MVRPRKIDREQLLDMAEEIIAAASPSGLTFGSLAAHAGIPKASIQSAFGTREALIDEMLARWMRAEQQRFNRNLGTSTSHRDRVLAHIQTTADDAPDEGSRVATLLAALAGSGEQSASTTRWYQSRIGSLTATTDEERRLRIALLAAEGAFYLRHLTGYPISEELWRTIFDDLLTFTSR